MTYPHHPRLTALRIELELCLDEADHRLQVSFRQNPTGAEYHPQRHSKKGIGQPAANRQIYGSERCIVHYALRYLQTARFQQLGK